MLDRSVSSFRNVCEAFHSQTNSFEMLVFSSTLNELGSWSLKEGESSQKPRFPNLTQLGLLSAEIQKRAKSCWLLKGEREKQREIKMSLPEYIKPKPSICIY